MAFFQPVVDETKCEGCETCMEDCPEEMFRIQNGKSVVVTEHACCCCQTCVEGCECGAIKIEEF